MPSWLHFDGSCFLLLGSYIPLVGLLLLPYALNGLVYLGEGKHCLNFSLAGVFRLPNVRGDELIDVRPVHMFVKVVLAKVLLAFPELV